MVTHYPISTHIDSKHVKKQQAVLNPGPAMLITLPGIAIYPTQEQTPYTAAVGRVDQTDVAKTRTEHNSSSVVLETL
jgi:hypothetical protein